MKSWKARLPNEREGSLGCAHRIRWRAQSGLAVRPLRIICGQRRLRAREPLQSGPCLRPRRSRPGLTRPMCWRAPSGSTWSQAGWRPTVDNYLGRVTKPRILEAVREAKGEPSAQLIDHLKKADMAKEAERLLDGTGWLPEPLRLVDVTAASGAGGEAGTIARIPRRGRGSRQRQRRGSATTRRRRMSCWRGTAPAVLVHASGARRAAPVPFLHCGQRLRGRGRPGRV